MIFYDVGNLISRAGHFSLRNTTIQQDATKLIKTPPRKPSYLGFIQYLELPIYEQRTPSIALPESKCCLPPQLVRSKKVLQKGNDRRDDKLHKTGSREINQKMRQRMTECSEDGVENIM